MLRLLLDVIPSGTRTFPAHMDCRNFIGDVALLAGKLLAASIVGALLLTGLAFLMGW